MVEQELPGGGARHGGRVQPQENLGADLPGVGAESVQLLGDEAAALGITTLCDQATGAIGGPAELDSGRTRRSDQLRKLRRLYSTTSSVAPFGALCKAA